MVRREFCKASLAAMASGLLPAGGMGFAAQNPGEFPRVSGLTRYVAEFVLNAKYADLSPEAIEAGRKSMLDGFGVALAGSRAETGPLSRKYVRSLGPCGGNAVVIGSSMRTSPRLAAFLNGISIHADDYDDTQLAVAKDRVYGLLMHPTVTALPPAFAAAGYARISGKDFMLAYQVGVEVECKIAEAISPRSYENGFHTTGMVGPFGAAASYAKLRGLHFSETLDAFGVAGAEGSGLKENFGTMTKPFQAGHAAECGVTAVDLAALGWTAAQDILEGPGGFFHAYGGGYDPAAIQGKLGNPWTFASPGVSIKPFPSGSLTHPGMGELERLIARNKITAAQVESIDVGTNHNTYNTLLRHDPQTGLEAKFSMEFCFAILLIEGKASLAQFTDAVVRRPDVQAMVRRVHYQVSPAAEAAGYNKMATVIAIHLKDGRTISGRADFAKGSPADPMSYDDVAAKFRSCAEYAGWPEDKSAKIIESVRSLESVADVGALAPLLAREGG